MIEAVLRVVLYRRSISCSTANFSVTQQPELFEGQGRGQGLPLRITDELVKFRKKQYKCLWTAEPQKSIIQPPFILERRPGVSL